VRRSLSAYWRVDESEERVAELASILEGAQKAIEVLGGRYQVIWSGETCANLRKKVIELDARVLEGLPTPVDNRAVDVVIGMAVHEAGHELWTPDITQHSNWGSLNTQEREELHYITNVLEDAYVDNNLGRISDTLAEYLRSARSALYPPWGTIATHLMAQAEEPKQEDIVQLWTATALYGEQIPSAASQAVANALQWLLDKTLDYIQERDKQKRLEMAVAVWEWLISKFPKGATFDDLRQEAKEEQSKRQHQGRKGQSGKTSGNQEQQPTPRSQSSETDEERDDDSGGDGEQIEAQPDDDESDDDKQHHEAEAQVERKEEAQVEPEEEDHDGDPEAEDPEADPEADEIEELDPDVEGLDEVEEQIQSNLWGGDEPGDLGDLDKYLDQPHQPLSKEEAEALGDFRESQRQDMTGPLRELGFTDTTTIKNASYDLQSHTQVKNQVVPEIQKVRHIFQEIEVVESRWRHGLENGKLDGRRLAKVGVGKTTVFKHRELRDQPSTAVVLLLDTSGSMQGRLYIVNETAAVFAEGLKPLYPKTWYEVITYTGRTTQTSGDVQLTRLASSTMRLSLRGVWHGGGTPSGEAIASALLLLRRRQERRKVIIHFTDGSPDHGSDVRKAVEICRQDGVEVITISVGYLPTAYGEGKAVVISRVEELPKAVMTLIKRIWR
jgi:cobalamin biosynthesis protein CobT